MIRTRVGYAGGTTPSPTYRSIGDHAEAIQIDFDPSVISFEELCKVFWTSHNPCGQSWSKQYASILFYADEAQLAVATATSEAATVSLNSRVTTPNVPLDVFYRAEDYHQKYQLRNHPLIKSVYPYFETDRDFVDSTLSMRLNAYLGASMEREDILAELSRLGFEPSSSGPIQAIRAMPSTSTK